MLVFTWGGTSSPRSAAFRATSPAATMTAGLLVFVHEVIAAITTEPWVSVVARPFVPTLAERPSSDSASP